MSSISAKGLRAGTVFLGGLLMLACATPAIADPKPLTKEEQAKVDQAIDKGVAFLKKAQTKDGDFGWKMYNDGRYLVGQCALPAYALLESGVSADDPVIQKAAEFLRRVTPLTDHTYELPLAILFFDRLGDPKDKKLIQGCALRLIAGQHRTGGWAYRCPILDDKNATDLLSCLEELNKRMKGGERTRGQALEEIEVPAALQSLTVFQSPNRLSWRDPELTADAKVDALNRVSLDGWTDNSNTQFALLGLWAARRHDVRVDSTLEISVERFERFHIYPGGFWLYGSDKELSARSRRSMTCVGLIALAIGRGLKLSTPGSPVEGGKDVHVLRGLAALSRQIGKPSGDFQKRRAHEELYFLWSVERVGMLFNLPTIGDKDWYRWGAEGLLSNQTRSGWWPDVPPERAFSEKAKPYKSTLCTSFALLFLKRSHPMKDLTAKLPFTAKELSEGIASLRPKDTFPVRIIASPSPSRDKKP
ncbi:MAG TPA: hypothetical protein VH643_03250 [Gemmataceae bacterium]|jgi:hypothetical protein